MLQPHSDAWYDRVSETQAGYHYPWSSAVPPEHGEDSFFRILKSELWQTDVVLDAGCGSGELTNQLAPLCRQIYGYDRVCRFIDLANKSRQPNATFILHDSRQPGSRILPIDGKVIDYFISSKGPSHWIEDVPRVAHGKAKLLMLMPYDGRPPEWEKDLPHELREGGFSKDQVLEDTRARLKSIGLEIAHVELFEVEETFSSQVELRRYLTWGKIDWQYDAIELDGLIDRLFSNYGKGKGLRINRCRLIWRSQIGAT